MSCSCHRHGYFPDVYLRCPGGLCGHPCDRDSRSHEPCDDLKPLPRQGAAPHSCGCLTPEEQQRQAVALITSMLL